MKKTALFSAAVLAVFATGGCISKRSGGTIGDETAWAEGVTSKREVMARWGNPDNVDGNVWVWRESGHLGGKVKASFWGIGFTVSKVNVSMCEHRLAFDGNDKLDKYEIHHSVSGGPSWSIIPW